MTTPGSRMMSYPDGTISTAEAIHMLVAQYGSAVPPYQPILALIASARLPAMRCGGRWRIRLSDIPEIARLLKLTDRAA